MTCGLTKGQGEGQLCQPHANLLRTYVRPASNGRACFASPGQVERLAFVPASGSKGSFLIFSLI